MQVTKDMVLWAAPLHDENIEAAKKYIENRCLNKEQVRLVTTTDNMVCIIARKDFILG